jgi:16S rRNA (cytosine967-C5)-methyltransferase
LNINILNNQARQAIELVRNYPGDLPFHLYLQHYFRLHKKFGSKDRKNLRNLTFAWFRLGRTLPIDENTALLTAFSLLNQESSCFSEHYNEPLPSDYWTWLNLRFPDWNPASIFPSAASLSPEFRNEDFYKSQVNQPLLWIWSEYHKDIQRYLLDTDILCETHPDVPLALGLPNGFNLETLPQKWRNKISVQDLSSQFFCTQIKPDSKESVWDCCAASGGKSLNLYAVNKSLKFYVSDVRPSILQSLKYRFNEFRLNNYHMSAIDLEKNTDEVLFDAGLQNEHKVGAGFFDKIILDAPCSGSGTWSRNPEGLLFSNNDLIENYQNTQKRILTNVWPFLKKGGLLYYLTCSVFEMENEEVVMAFNNPDAERVSQSYFHGDQHQSDSMFCAVLRKI